MNDKNIIDALIPAARLVYEQGGWSGTSGNWPLVEAFDKLEALKDAAPEVYARLNEKLPPKEYTDEPCTLCNGTGKSPGKTLGEIEGNAFEQGKEVQAFIDGRTIGVAEVALTEISCGQTAPQHPDDAAKAALAKIEAFKSSTCTCPHIQAKDPRRHFKGCPERKPLGEETIKAIEGAAPVAHCEVWSFGCTNDDSCVCACNGCTGERIQTKEIKDKEWDEAVEACIGEASAYLDDRDYLPLRDGLRNLLRKKT